MRLAASDSGVTARLVFADDASRLRMAGQLPDLVARLQAAGVTLGGFDLAHQGGKGQGEWNEESGEWRNESRSPSGRVFTLHVPFSMRHGLTRKLDVTV
jgi:hypothetical protein